MDPKEGRVRRFVKMGGRSKRWHGVAVKHGREAQANLERAVALKLPVFGYEAEPDPSALERGERSVKHFYLDRPHQLKGWIGLSLHNLDERLHIEDAFRMRGFSNPRDTNIPGTLFELISSTVEATDTPFADIPLEEEIDEAEEISQVFEGNRSADEYAPIALLLLVIHVFQQTDEMLVPLTYQNLA